VSQQPEKYQTTLFMGQRNKRRQKQRRLSISIQGGLLKKYFPDSKLTNLMGISLQWDVAFKPTPFSQSYKIRIEYTLGFPPKTYVIEPKKLVLHSDAKGLPHVYDNKSQRLCLYYPDGKDWNQGKALVNTIVPWAAEWLFFYENWLQTGEWHGGGVHPTNRKKNNIKHK
jgi:hypothetical protein